MRTINRTAVTIVPRKPYIDWANSFDDGPELDTASSHATSLLIPDTYDEYSYETFIKRNYRMIFEEELSSWITDPASWPKRMSYDVFREWFDIIPSDTILELGDGEIEIEDY